MIKAKKDFTLSGKFYTTGDEVIPNNKEELIRLNEKGFIEPLTAKEIQDYFAENKKYTYKKKEE